VDASECDRGATPLEQVKSVGAPAERGNSIADLPSRFSTVGRRRVEQELDRFEHIVRGGLPDARPYVPTLLPSSDRRVLQHEAETFGIMPIALAQKKRA